MKEISEWQVPKWPFLLAGALLLATAGTMVWLDKSPFGQLQIILATASVALGAVLACLPYLLEYRATSKLVEINAVSTLMILAAATAAAVYALALRRRT